MAASKHLKRIQTNGGALHPDFKHLQRHAPEHMPIVTQAVSGPMVERCIRYATRHRVSVLVEGTFRDPAMVTATAQQYHEAGLRVHAVALAVPPEVSRAGTLSRFHETQGTGQNRWTPPHAHDAALRGMPATVEAHAVSTDVERLSVLTREGEVLFDSDAPGATRAREAGAHIERTHTRELTAGERELVAATGSLEEASGDAGTRDG